MIQNMENKVDKCYRRKVLKNKLWKPMVIWRKYMGIEEVERKNKEEEDVGNE